MKGRLGDSPIIGAGLFVDNEIGAAVSSGQGEEVIRIAGTHLVVEMMRMGKTPEEACKGAIERLVKINPEKAWPTRGCCRQVRMFTPCRKHSARRIATPLISSMNMDLPDLLKGEDPSWGNCCSS